MKTIEEEWQGFSAMIFAGMTLAPNQAEEMRKAFFAGAWSMLCAMRRIGEPDISEDAGVQYFDDRQREGESFYRDLIKNHSERN